MVHLNLTLEEGTTREKDIIDATQFVLHYA
jgi:hypothetical protein